MPENITNDNAESTHLTREHFEEHVNPKLRSRVRMYLAISVIMALVISYRILSATGSFLYPSLAFAIGLIVGIIVSRMYVISWDKDAEHVVSRMDTYGTIFLIAYILFEILSHYFIGQWFQGPEVSTIVLASVGGALLGRGLGMLKKMIRVLRVNI